MDEVALDLGPPVLERIEVVRHPVNGKGWSTGRHDRARDELASAGLRA
jgi:hypothetical protein